MFSFRTSPYQPRVNFHSIESLVSSDISSRDDGNYHSEWIPRRSETSFDSIVLDLNTSDKENHPSSTSKKVSRLDVSINMRTSLVSFSFRDANSPIGKSGIFDKPSSTVDIRHRTNKNNWLVNFFFLSRRFGSGFRTIVHDQEEIDCLFSFRVYCFFKNRNSMSIRIPSKGDREVVQLARERLYTIVINLLG